MKSHDQNKLLSTPMTSACQCVNGWRGAAIITVEVSTPSTQEIQNHREGRIKRRASRTLFGSLKGYLLSLL